MITVNVDPAQIKRLKAALGENARKLQQDVATVVNMTATATRNELAGPRGVRSELLVKSADAKNAITKTRASKTKPTAIVRVKKEKRFPLRLFKHTELKRGGVSYKTSPKRGTRRVRNAFIPRPGANVMKRRGPSRYPVSVLHAGSPWGAVKTTGLEATIRRFARKRLSHEMNRRIKFRKLKASGAI